MAFKPRTTIYQATGTIGDHGVAKTVSQTLLLEMMDDVTSEIKYEWHFYGMPAVIPLGWVARYPDAAIIEHTETLFPPALNDLPDGDMGLFGVAHQIEINRLSR